MNSDHLLLKARNAVLRHNPRVAANNITTRGSNWLWTVCALMSISTLAFIATTARVKRHVSPRLHYIAVTITLVSAFTYFVMASNLGGTPITEEFMRGGNRPGPTREVFYARWIEYFITFSLEILALHIIARTAWNTRLFVVAMTMFMIVCHLTGALVRSKYKWGFLVFGIFGYLLVAWRTLTGLKRGTIDADPNARDGNHTMQPAAHSTAPGVSAPEATAPGVDDRAKLGEGHHHGISSSERAGATPIGRKHHGLAAYLLSLSLLYPICWGVSEAGNVISLDGECIFYGILDLLTKPVFLALLLFSTREGRHTGTAAGTEPRKNRLWSRKTSADTAGSRLEGASNPERR